MKKIIIISVALFVFITTIKAVKIKFTVANMSVNVAEGSIGVFVALEMHPNSFLEKESINSRGLIEFNDILYKDILEVVIEKTPLNNQTSSFFKLAAFSVTDSTTYGKKEDNSIIQGNTYVYRLVIVTKSGQQFNLAQKSIQTKIANPKMNCAKFNNIYRLAGHNNYQESVISPSNGGFYQTMSFTRVLELDVHASMNPTTWNWEVRHIGSGNKNNCGYGTSGDNPFGICIDDMKQWHINHPNHDVIVLFIDLKSDWNKYNNNQTPADLDQRLLSLVSNADMIYKPRDLLGNNLNSNVGDMQLAAQQNNWPSMGDLTGKFMFVLTGDGSKVSEYIADRSLNAVAFAAANVASVSDVVNLPGIWPGLKNDIVFYNQDYTDISNGAGNFASANRYINRVWHGNWATGPGTLTNSEYANAIDENINNIATKLVWATPSPTNGRPANGIQRIVSAENPLINNSRIYSNYENVTQAATQTITATNLIVESGTHYRMIAGGSIDLQPGVDLQSGSNVDVRIDDCENANYSLRKAKHQQLTQKQIDALMHELNKDLYNYIPKDENEVVGLTIYPNPTSGQFNITIKGNKEQVVSIELLDILGNTIFKTNESKSDYTFDLSGYPKGMYLLRTTINSTLHVKKIIFH